MKLNALLMMISTAFAHTAVAQATDTEVEATLPPAPPSIWILSARGLPQDSTALAAGLAYADDTPAVDLRLLHGLTDRVAIDVEVATLGYAQWARAGVRLEAIEREELSIAVRACLVEAHLVTERSAVVSISAGPGAVASYGTESVQLTLSLDVLIGIYETDSAAVRTAIGLELPIDLGLGLVMESGALLTTAGDSTPFFSAGLTW